MKFLKWGLLSLVGLVVALAVGVQVYFAMAVGPVEPFVPTPEEEQDLALFHQPESWFLEHLQGPREVIDGQTLDPKFQYLAERNRPAADFVDMTAPLFFATPWGRDFIRYKIDRTWRLYGKETRAMARVEDRQIAGRATQIPVRIYWPQNDSGETLPILVYHHGGGWIFSSIAAMDMVCRQIANEARAIVISVNYRLAPEHPYPAASDDGEDVFLWARANAVELGGDAARIGVGGDSAGGHVSINIAQRQLKAGKPGPVAMLLFYPGTGLPQNDASYRLFGKGYGLDASFIEFILPRVFTGFSPERVEEADELMDPSRAKSLAGMPPTVIATAGFDILRDSGRRFADRMRADGVPLNYTNYPSLTHSFLQFTAVVADADKATTTSARLFGDAIRASDARQVLERAASE